jgi:uncharacterized protein (TIGR00369 family)
MLEYLQKMVAGEVSGPPVAQLIGMQLVAVHPGRVVIELEAGQRHASPLGTVHGGILCALADAAMGLAYATTLQETETFGTVELKINFLRPVWQGWLRAEGKVVNSGRNLGLVECDVIDQEQRLIARALSTCMILRGDQAEIDHGKSEHKKLFARRPR